MFDFIPALGSVMSFGSGSAVAKKAISDIGRHRAIVYAYAVLIPLLLIGALALNIEFVFPQELLPAYAVQVVLGALGAIAAYKALDYGKASIVSPIAKIYVVLVLLMSIVFLGEQLSAIQLMGSFLIVVSAVVLALDNKGKLKPEKWMVYLAISVACRAYYYTFIKNFVLAMGPYQATVALEIGITAFVVAFHSIRGRDLALPSFEKMNFAAASGTLLFLGTVLYSFSVGIIGAALTAAISAGAPIVNTVVSHFLLGERLGAYKYAATALLVIGLVMIFILG